MFGPNLKIWSNLINIFLARITRLNIWFLSLHLIFVILKNHSFLIKPYFNIITVFINFFAKTLGNTIESVLSKNYTNYEYIVIAGENSDGTDEVLSHYHKHIDIIRSGRRNLFCYEQKIF